MQPIPIDMAQAQQQAPVILEQANGQKLMLKPGSILFIEDLSAETKKANRGAQCGILYDLGAGVAGALLKMPFPRVLKLAAPAGTWVQVGRPAPQSDRAAVLAHSIEGMRGLGESDGANLSISWRAGPQVYSLEAMQTFDEIHAMMTAAAPPGLRVIQEEERDDGEAADQGTKRRGGGRGAGGAGGVRTAGSGKAPRGKG